MKLFSVVLFGVLAALVCADHEKGWRKEFKKTLKKCMDKNKVDTETLEKNMDKEEPEVKVKCVSACIWEEMKIMNADGSPNEAGVDAMIAKMPEKTQEHTKKIVAECMKLMKADLPECESGHKFSGCLIKKKVFKIRPAHGSGQDKEFKQMQKKCMVDNKVDKETLKSIKDKADPPTNVKCVSDCMCQKMNIINADGSPNLAGADATIDKLVETLRENTKKSVHECMKLMEAGLPKCESAYKYQNCMREKMPRRKHKSEKKEADEDH